MTSQRGKNKKVAHEMQSSFLQTLFVGMKDTVKTTTKETRRSRVGHKSYHTL